MRDKGEKASLILELIPVQYDGYDKRKLSSPSERKETGSNEVFEGDCSRLDFLGKASSCLWVRRFVSSLSPTDSITSLSSKSIQELFYFVSHVVMPRNEKMVRAFLLWEPFILPKRDLLSLSGETETLSGSMCCNTNDIKSFKKCCPPVSQLPVWNSMLLLLCEIFE